MSQPESAIRDDSETAPASAIADPVPRSRWWVLAVVCVGTMMTFVNVSSTIGGLAIIQSDLHAGSAAAVWISSAYSLVVASLVLGAGTLADLIGRRLVFAAGATLFAVGSATAFASHSTPALIAAQVVMGVGGAMVLPAGLAIVSHAFADHERTEAISIWAGSSGLGLAVGPLVAGALLGTFSWHSIYMINVVLGAIALLGAVTLVAASRQPGRTLDPVGIALGTLAVGALTYAVIEGGASGYTAGPILVAYAVLAVSLVGFVWYEARHPDPMLDVTLFRSASFSAVMAAAAITMFAFTGTALVTVLYLQHVQETTPLGAGSRPAGDVRTVPRRQCLRRSPRASHRLQNDAHPGAARDGCRCLRAAGRPARARVRAGLARSAAGGDRQRDARGSVHRGRRHQCSAAPGRDGQCRGQYVPPGR
jgi:DHA2 family multidrug resistance protein-like MFS transporter